NLVILTPSSLARQKVSLVSSGGGIIETAAFVGRTNGDRATYRFSRPGSAYNRNIVLRVGSTDYQVKNPALRVN
ncbi:MAG: hypothetical protein KAG14_04890, partial [Mycoplasmataceae bacterium]|nr:hypothetical protein [Mycoplasmataceae bacterium]